MIKEAIDIHRRDRYTQKVYRTRAEEALALEKTQRLADKELNLRYKNKVDKANENLYKVKQANDNLSQIVQTTKTDLQTEKTRVLSLQAHIKALETRLSPAPLPPPQAPSSATTPSPSRPSPPPSASTLAAACSPSF